MALETSAEQPASVRRVSMAIAEWVGRLGAVWLEGQVAQLSRRPGARQAWITLRDVDVDMSVTVVVGTTVLDAMDPPLRDGQRVVIHARPEVYEARGSLQLRAREIRPIGIGALLAQIEHLRSVLAAEGVFDASRKRRLPFLPGRVGLICGRASAAMHDVLVNARARWPEVEFEVREVAVQGPQCVPSVVAALEELDADPAVDVIVVARGGGSVEDLLPFSNERLVRAIAGCRTPVVSAIGHEQDAPLADFAADVRASTPTDAAKRIVPDVAEERELVSSLRARGRRVVGDRLAADARWLRDARGRPCLADPAGAIVASRQRDVGEARLRARLLAGHRLDRAEDDLAHVVARVRSLSPQATLDRGYAIVQAGDGGVVRDADAVNVGADVTVMLARGRFPARRIG